jgi:ATP adenylyltransferase
MHEQLWAPWRLGYILGDKPAEPDLSQVIWLPEADRGCFLCRAACDLDRRSTLTPIVTPNALVVLNRYPYNNGHLLIAPRRHAGELSALTLAEQSEIDQLLVRMTEILREKMNCDGFNVGLNLGRVAGASFPGHLHWHIVPRWSGDSNFMPTLAGVRVIPQALESLYEMLYEECS